jgi:hypothetical protein
MDRFAWITCGLLLLALGTCTRGPSLKPTGEISFSSQSYSRQSADCDSASSPCARIRIQYPEITGAPKPAIRDSIQAWILDFVLRRTDDTLRAPSVDAVIEEFLDGFEEFRRQYPEAGQSWEVDRQVSVLPSVPGIFSLEAREFTATGGAHPNSNIQLASFEVTSGRRLSLSDLLVPGHGPPLSALAEKGFRVARAAPADSSLEALGFWFEGGQFRLPRNFAVTADGLRFYFNAYEVGPYVLGPTDFLVSYDDISGLIRSDGPLASRGPRPPS